MIILADFNPEKHFLINFPILIFIVAGIDLYLVTTQAVPFWAFQLYNTVDILTLFVVFSLVSIFGGLVAEFFSSYHPLTLSFVAVGFYALSILPLTFIGLLTAYVSTAEVIGIIDIFTAIRIIMLVYKIGFIAGTRQNKH